MKEVVCNGCLLKLLTLTLTLWFGMAVTSEV